MTTDKSFTVLAISIGKLKNIDGYENLTGIDKQPIEENSIQITNTGIIGDEINNKKIHGGVDRAVYVMGDADTSYWQKELNKEIRPGLMGENLVLDNFDTHDFFVNDRLVFPNVTLEATFSRVPCATFAAHMNDKYFPKKFTQSGHIGVYFRVIKEGTISVGDVATLDKSNSTEQSILDFSE